MALTLGTNCGLVATAPTTDPNPPSLNPADWGTEDTLWIITAAGDGNVAFTAADALYDNTSFLLSTDSTTGNRCTLGSAERQLNAASVDPDVYTRLSEDWITSTLGVRPAPSATPIQVLREETFYGTGDSSYNNTVTLPAGTNRRFFVAVGAELTSGITVSSVTYGEESATLVTDGTDTANFGQNTGGVARVTWWEILEANLPSDGENTLNVTLSASNEVHITAITVSGRHLRVAVYQRLLEQLLRIACREPIWWMWDSYGEIMLPCGDDSVAK